MPKLYKGAQTSCPSSGKLLAIEIKVLSELSHIAYMYTFTPGIRKSYEISIKKKNTCSLFHSSDSSSPNVSFGVQVVL